jgi:hypothetical protein
MAAINPLNAATPATALTLSEFLTNCVLEDNQVDYLSAN